MSRLVHTLEWRDRLALVLIEGLVNDATVLNVNIGLRGIRQPCQSVLHPVFIVTLEKDI